jgi:hypothetical protein
VKRDHANLCSYNPKQNAAKSSSVIAGTKRTRSPGSESSLRKEDDRWPRTNGKLKFICNIDANIVGSGSSNREYRIYIPLLAILFAILFAIVFTFPWLFPSLSDKTSTFSHANPELVRDIRAKFQQMKRTSMNHGIWARTV